MSHVHGLLYSQLLCHMHLEQGQKIQLSQTCVEKSPVFPLFMSNGETQLGTSKMGLGLFPSLYSLCSPSLLKNSSLPSHPLPSLHTTSLHYPCSKLVCPIFNHIIPHPRAHWLFSHCDYLYARPTMHFLMNWRMLSPHQL